MGSASPYATSSNGHYVYANITWDDNLKVTVNITSVNAGWCVKIRGTTNIKCQGSMSNTTGTFNADYDGQEFTLQVYDVVEGSFVNNGNPVFKVTNNSGGDSGGNTGGNTGGGTTTDLTTPRWLWICAGEGTTITVNRLNTTYESESQGSYIGELTNPDDTDEDDWGIWYGFKVWPHEYFKITANALDGYTIDTYELDPVFIFGDDGSSCTFNFETEYLSYLKGSDEWDLWSYDLDIEPWIYSSATPNEYKLSISESVGSHVKVTRKSSNKSGAALGVLNNGDAIYHSDTLEISVSLETGYDIIDTIVTGCTENNDGTFTVTGNTNVTVITELMGIVYIDNGTTFVPCLIFIDNGSDWEQCIPYIDNGTSWVLCS